jgi:integrase
MKSGSQETQRSRPRFLGGISAVAVFMKVPRLFACERTAWAPPGTNALIHDYLEVAGYGTDDSGALFRPIKNNRGKTLDQALTPDAVYKLVKAYSAQLGFEIGAHALRATAATNALDHQADIAKVQEWLGHANIATTRIYDHRKSRPEDTDVQGQLLTSHFQDASNRQ